MERESSYGPIIGLVIIILIIALGSVYFLNQRENEDLIDTNSATEQTLEQEHQEVLTDIEEQSSTDDLESIEADLNATNLDSLDTNLDELTI